MYLVKHARQVLCSVKKVIASSLPVSPTLYSQDTFVAKRKKEMTTYLGDFVKAMGIASVYRNFAHTRLFTKGLWK